MLSLAIWTAVPAIFFAAIGVWFWRIGGFPRVLSVVWLAAAAGAVLLARRTLARAEREARFLDP